jgi:rare lipoprotein A
MSASIPSTPSALRALTLTLVTTMVSGCSLLEPQVRQSGKSQYGVASWYGAAFAGRKTASGETFDPNDMTAAHRTLPFGCKVQVTHRNNKRYVRVKVNDRGPFSHGRIIDLSEEAAEKLAMKTAGVAPVRVDLISCPRKK